MPPCPPGKKKIRCRKSIGMRQCIKGGLWCGRIPQPKVIQEVLHVKFNILLGEQIRNTTFFSKLNAEALYKSQYTVSNAGRKRGRGSLLRLKKKPNLNKGQYLGVGKDNIAFPGLNMPIVMGQDVLNLEKRERDPEYFNKLQEARKLPKMRRSIPIHPLQRGWCGKSVKGKSMGPPQITEEEYNVKDFDTVVLHVNYVSKMTATFGRVQKARAYVAAGNGKGLLGVGVSRGADQKTAVKKGQMRAMTKLIHYKLEDPRTLNHNFYSKFGKTKVFAYKKPEGFGLICHRAIATICKLLGIKDLYAKVEGSGNVQFVIKAFLLGLLEQKSYKQIADENNLHVVELRPEKKDYPTVLASPEKMAATREYGLDFQQYVMGGIPLIKPKVDPWTKSKNYYRHIKKNHFKKNHDLMKLNILAEYGELRSHLHDVYPECKAKNLSKKYRES